MRGGIGGGLCVVLGVRGAGWATAGGARRWVCDGGWCAAHRLSSGRSTGKVRCCRKLALAPLGFLEGTVSRRPDLPVSPTWNTTWQHGRRVGQSKGGREAVPYPRHRQTAALTGEHRNTTACVRTFGFMMGRWL